MRISDSDWTEINNIVNALKPAKITTTIFQREKLFVGKFFRSWLTCKIYIEKVGCLFSNNLVQFMNERKKVLLHNEAMLTAILLDPRYKVMLTESEQEIAKKYINQA